MLICCTNTECKSSVIRRTDLDKFFDENIDHIHSYKCRRCGTCFEVLEKVTDK